MAKKLRLQRLPDLDLLEAVSSFRLMGFETSGLIVWADEPERRGLGCYCAASC